MKQHINSNGLEKKGYIKNVSAKYTIRNKSMLVQEVVHSFPLLR